MRSWFRLFVAELHTQKALFPAHPAPLAGKSSFTLAVGNAAEQPEHERAHRSRALPHHPRQVPVAKNQTLDGGVERYIKK